MCIFNQICGIFVTDLSHSLQINLHFGNNLKHAYQYSNLTGVHDKKKAYLLSCDFLGKPDTPAWKDGVLPPYQKIFGLSYKAMTTAQTLAQAQASADPWPGSGIIPHAYRDEDHITHYEGPW